MTDHIAAAADAIEEAAQIGYSMTLVRLVDGVSTYQLIYNGGRVSPEPLEFPGTDEAYQHIAETKAAARRDAVMAFRDGVLEEAAAECAKRGHVTSADAIRALKAPRRAPCGDDIVLWPDGTTATLGEVRSGGYDWMSDDCEVIAFDDAAKLAARGITPE